MAQSQLESLTPGPAREPVRLRVAGAAAEFDDPNQLLAAAEKIRDAGFRKWDCYTPFPVHGLDDAMGVKPTILPWLVLGAGLTGLCVALGFQSWSNGMDYAWNISGKPLFSVPANIPIAFELTVLFSALTCFFGVLILNQLPQWYHPAFRLDRFARFSNDKFFLIVEARDPQFDAKKTPALVASLGAAWAGPVEEPETGDPYPVLLRPAVLLAGMFLAIPPLLIANARNTKSAQPRIHIVQDMDAQAKFKAQTATGLFADGRSARPPAAGVVARGDVRGDDHLHLALVAGKVAEGFPAALAPSKALMARGQQQFEVHCALCHGYAGEGNGLVHQRALENREPTWIPPTNLHDPRIVGEKDGHLATVIANGVRNMPAYGHKIPAEDRWAIVLYVRALQLSQAAEANDLPADVKASLRTQ